MQATSIEWTDMSANPIRARNKATGKNCHWCLKISPGCAKCYSSRMQVRFGGKPFELRFADDVEVWFDDSVLERIIRRRKPARIFWCDMTDMFGDWVPNEWIDKIMATCALTPQHTHQVLTKRAERLPVYFNERAARDRVFGQMVLQRPYVLNRLTTGFPRTAPVQWPLPNVHLGVSVEDQQRADERIPHLLRTPAAVRWLSCEPLLGPVDLTKIGLTRRPDGRETWTDAVAGAQFACDIHAEADVECNRLDWIVGGAESGPGSRPAEVAWFRSLRDQCAAAGVPYFQKQLGPMLLIDTDERDEDGDRRCVFDGKNFRDGFYGRKFKDKKGGDMSEWFGGLEDLRVRQFPEALRG